MSEQSLVLIKPDAVERHLIGSIIHEYERNDLKVDQLKLIQADEDLAKAHYAEHKDKPFFDELVEFITRSPVVAMVISGEEAISRVRQINGATRPEEAEPNTIRAVYALSMSENSVHASDSPESAEREISIWFG